MDDQSQDPLRSVPWIEEWLEVAARIALARQRLRRPVGSPVLVGGVGDGYHIMSSVPDVAAVMAVG